MRGHTMKTMTRDKLNRWCFIGILTLLFGCMILLSSCQTYSVSVFKLDRKLYDLDASFSIENIATSPIKIRKRCDTVFELLRIEPQPIINVIAP